MSIKEHNSVELTYNDFKKLKSLVELWHIDCVEKKVYDGYSNLELSSILGDDFGYLLLEDDEMQGLKDGNEYVIEALLEHGVMKNEL